MLGTANRVSYNLAARVDDNSDYAAHSTYRIGTSIPLASGTHVRASVGTAFNAPAFSQIRPTLYTVGSPDLSPEKSRSWEVGIEQSFASDVARLSASHFNQRFADLIQFVFGGPPSYKGSYANLAEAQSNGYEAELDITPPGIVSASGSFTQSTPRVTRLSSAYSGDLTVGQALIRRPTHAGSATFTVSPRGASLSATAMHVGKRPDVDFAAFPSPTVTLPAYDRVDISGTLDVWRRASASLSLTARAENAFDRKYQTVLHFPAPGRVILLGARFSGSL